MRTGNTRNYRNDQGQRVVEVQSAICTGESLEFLPHNGGLTWFASFAGWYRQHNVGSAATREGAIRDLAAQCGTTAQAIESECEIRETSATL